MCQSELNQLPETEIYRFVKEVKRLTAKAVPKYSSRYSRKDYTLRQHAALICLKIRKKDTYREICDELVEMLRVRKELNLDKIPHSSTLCRAFNKLSMQTWRTLLKLSWKILDLTGVTGVDASGFDRSHASRHYTQRTGLKIRSLKTTLLVDTEGTIIDIHVTTTRKHDTKIAPQPLKRNTENIDVLLGDKGYDDQKLRKKCRNHGITPIIKHREFTENQKQLNEELDKELYGKRNINETINSSLKRKYGSHATSRTWYKQFREITAKYLIQNVEKNLSLYLAPLHQTIRDKLKRVATEPNFL